MAKPYASASNTITRVLPGTHDEVRAAVAAFHDELAAEAPPGASIETNDQGGFDIFLEEDATFMLTVTVSASGDGQRGVVKADLTADATRRQIEENYGGTKRGLVEEVNESLTDIMDSIGEALREVQVRAPRPRGPEREL